jgi:hypothetical protein
MHRVTASLVPDTVATYSMLLGSISGAMLIEDFVMS